MSLSTCNENVPVWGSADQSEPAEWNEGGDSGGSHNHSEELPATSADGVPYSLRPDFFFIGFV